ncbi:endonuclease/exonuclease/phosphatase family protein [Prosthecochloris sp. GSB1]|uniref:endonuclease/exonuclease/phosphatase family protein n=1 Tax=Prosthecochloris sp. GSB1 TaxID=281093 RepID=UPI00142DD58D|nr:endonuclease/exonuclease/phosphatase family protein [Prosthecochloris sp. GSB1]
MPMYSYLRGKIKKTDERRRAVTNLIALRNQLDDTVPTKDAEDTLLLATWNIRDFGKPGRRFGWGARLPESHFYIAEVISRFDFVAIQEVNELDEWFTVMDILGGDWDFIATDATDSAMGGNGERMVFVYDKRKVWFQKIAGEIVLPPNYLISKAELEVEGKKIVAGNQFKRTPFIASFQSGWLKFDICTVHLYYGADRGEKLAQRIEEIETVAKYLGKRADRSLGDDRALILLGDFNIVSPEHQTMQALVQNGFLVPEILRQKPTTGTEKYYDQIAFKTRPEVVEYIERHSGNPLELNAGVLALFNRVFADSQFETYADIVRKKTTEGCKADTNEKLKKAYRKWRTWQFSDHYPMWVRLQTDRSGDYLKRFLENG